MAVGGGSRSHSEFYFEKKVLYQLGPTDILGDYTMYIFCVRGQFHRDSRYILVISRH